MHILVQKSSTIVLVSLWMILGVVIYAIADTSSTSVTVPNSTPVISSLTLNSGNAITLIENSSVWASTTLTVTDANGCSTITSVSAKIYVASTSNEGTVCTQGDNDCYVDTSFNSCTATTTGNTCTGGSDTSVEYDCAFNIQYLAEATASGAPVWASSIWSVSATSSDGTSTSTATNTAETIEVNILAALDVTATIAYGSVNTGSDTAATNQSVTITNTGNIAIDNEISGDLMCTDYSTCAGGVMQPTQQKFDTTDVTYASLTNTLVATPSPATIELDLAKPTATTSAITVTTFWGIAVPVAQTAGSYTGLNTFTAIAD